MLFPKVGQGTSWRVGPNNVYNVSKYKNDKRKQKEFLFLD
jgi:hypothetical protein